MLVSDIFIHQFPNKIKLFSVYILGNVSTGQREFRGWYERRCRPYHPQEFLSRAHVRKGHCRLTGFTHPPTELALVEAARMGDRQAFGALVARCYAPLVALLYRVYGDAQLAEDAAQEACIRAWQRLDSYKKEHPFKNWLYRIAANAALDMLRREAATVQLDERNLLSHERGPEAAYESKERGEAVRQAVLDLPPASRLVLVLREYGGLSYQEISGVLDIPVGTVMSRLNYARTQLRQSLAHLQEKA
jgi:RNA polymerase sigma-70 factor, ECF subfamily